MKKTGRIIAIVLFSLAGLLFISGLIMAYVPFESKIKNHKISTEEAKELRNNFKGPHEIFKTSDGETLFMRRWNPDSIETGKKDIAVLLFHGITAHSGAYNMAGKLISKAGYTVFGLDYRGHGLSGGNRADSPSKKRWLADLAESVQHVKSLGFTRVIVFGHSLGVASAIYAAKEVPDEIAGLILLSGAYEGKKNVTAPPGFMQKAKILASSIFRPSVQVVEYYRDGMTGIEDPLFNFKYTLRFLKMLDVKELYLPGNWNIPVLVGVGDKDELFEVEKVRELYEQIPGSKKEFVVLKNTFHARFPDESWQELIKWLDNNFNK